jgi:hypothetical protein
VVEALSLEIQRQLVRRRQCLSFARPAHTVNGTDRRPRCLA